MNAAQQSREEARVKPRATKKKATSKKKAKPAPVVFTKWEEINTAVLKMDEQECEAAMAAEIAGPNRIMFKLRLHSRLNKMRAHRERRELRES